MPETQALLLQAISLAERARHHGNHPFGALLADADGHVLLIAENTVVTTADVTGHAERTWCASRRRPFPSPICPP